IWEFNRTYRQVDNPTDVLSFPNISFEAVSDFSIVEKSSEDYFDPDSGELILGDIILCADKIKEQALDFGHSEKREFAFLIAHSMLHLCGYDHMVSEEAAVMEEKQRIIMNTLHISRD
ncbi:MAG: rRNA maturation RNase YbeY, partial [Lachnospiraceae bacterium]|nr:rRNA maturation RNase YbeY [Lachnospiraceae bacterium]